MIVHFADYAFDASRREFARAGRIVPLTPKAFALVEKLVAAHPAAVSREDLYDALWPGVFVEMGNLYTLVAEIRSAAGDDSIIRTVHRFGYSLGLEVSSCQDLAAARLITDFGTIPLHPGENVIGRDLVPHAEVSRRHARITLTDDCVTVEDLGSRNGTWIGGKRIDSPTALKHGEIVMLGGTRAILSFPRDPMCSTADLVSTP